MDSPLIAVVGSVSADELNTYDPPLANVQQANGACEMLGLALAEAGCRIIVYSAEPGMIEPSVVKGYASSAAAKSGSITVRAPRWYADAGKATFEEQEKRPDLFVTHYDPGERWEATYYKSLKDVSGVMLLGGRGSAFTTGMVALAYRLPLLSVTAFGGAGKLVWTYMSPHTDLVTPDTHNLMGSPIWHDTMAKPLVAALLAQHNRLLGEKKQEHDRLLESAARDRLAERIRQLNVGGRAMFVLCLAVLAVVLTALAMFWPSPPSYVFALSLFGTPMLAGAAGGIVRTIYDPAQVTSEQPPRSIKEAASLGLVAGVIAAIGFLGAQSATNDNIRKNLGAALGDPNSGLGLLVPFMLVAGFTAGLTFEAVFGKLQRADMINLEDIRKGQPGK